MMKIRIRIKVVPDDKPNDDGRWIEGETEILPSDSFQNNTIRYKGMIPPGHHIVMFDFPQEENLQDGGPMHARFLKSDS